jgi:dTDP-4-amino-4,6-dideoxygalactose transaminase
MSELHAAVLLVQLGRLDQMVADMKERKARLKEEIREPLTARGVSFRTIHDPAGDTSSALVFYLPEARGVAEVAAALADENVPASRLYHELAYLPHDHVDLHVYSAWTPILQQKAWTGAGAPWRTHPRVISYSPEMCPRSLDLLRRAIHLDVSPDLTEQQVEEMAAATVAVIEKRV